MSAPAAAPAALDLQEVTRIHRDGPDEVRALDAVSLTVEPGRLLAVMGPSGSGKSTLLNIAGTLDAPTHGRVLIDGVDVAGMSRDARADIRREHLGYVFQDFNLLPTLTVAENIALPLELGGAGAAARREAARAALAELGLEALAGRFPAECSGGQRQRIAIARALVGRRRLILADEPTGALDTTTAEQVLAVLRGRVDAGAAAVLVTHEPRFAAWADEVIQLRDGRILGGDR